MSHSKLYIIILICLVFDVYANVLGGQFAYDDYYFVRDNPGVHTLSNFTGFFTDTNRSSSQEMRWYVYRPLTVLSFALTYKVFGLDPLPYHLINIILHALNAVLVFFLCRHFPPFCKGRKGGVDPIYPPSPSLTKGGNSFDDLKAFFIAAIFAVHPVQTEAVSWISGRGNVQFLFFMLAAFLIYLKYNEIRNPKSEIRNKSEARNTKYETSRVLNFGHSNLFWISIFDIRIYIIYLASLILFILSMFSKETGIVLPVLILVYYLFASNGNPVRPELVEGRSVRKNSFMVRQAHHERKLKVIKTHVIRLLPFFVVAAMFLGLRSYLLGTVGQMSISFPSVTNHLLTIIWTLATYLKLAVFPWRLTVEYMLPSAQLLYGPLTGVALSSIILITYFTCRLKKLSHLYPLGAIWFLIGVLPVLNIIPIHAFVYERFLYLPVIGFAFILVQGVFDIQTSLRARRAKQSHEFASSPANALWRAPRNNIVVIFLVIILCLYSVRTVIRNMDWTGPIPLWSSVLRENPRSPTAKYNLAVEYYDIGDKAKAMEYYLKGMENYGSSGMFSRINLAQMLKEEGKIDVAMVINDDTMRLFPRKSPAYVNQSWIYMGKGDYKKAEAFLTAALQIEPDSYYVNQALAALYEKTGRTESAKKYREITEKLSPNFGVTGERF